MHRIKQFLFRKGLIYDYRTLTSKLMPQRKQTLWGTVQPQHMVQKYFCTALTFR